MSVPGHSKRCNVYSRPSLLKNMKHWTNFHDITSGGNELETDTKRHVRPIQ